jgi:hypothetical protein
MGASGELSGDTGLRPWLLGIARHKVEDYYRRRLRQMELQEEEDSGVESAVLPIFEEQLDLAAQQAKVRRILALLPEPYRLVLRWRYTDSRSLRELRSLPEKRKRRSSGCLLAVAATTGPNTSPDRPCRDQRWHTSLCAGVRCWWYRGLPGERKQFNPHLQQNWPSLEHSGNCRAARIWKSQRRRTNLTAIHLVYSC